MMGKGERAKKEDTKKDRVRGWEGDVLCILRGRIAAAEITTQQKNTSSASWCLENSLLYVGVTLSV